VSDEAINLCVDGFTVINQQTKFISTIEA